MKEQICEECGEVITDTIFLVMSLPDSSFRTKILGKFCEKCGKSLIEEYRKEGHTVVKQ